MLKNDLWINQKASEGMINPFQSNLVRHLEPDNQQKPVLSYGCSSYGYDLRLSSNEFLIFRHIPGTVMNPKKFNPNNLEKTVLHHDDDGDFFILPAHSYGLGGFRKNESSRKYNCDLHWKKYLRPSRNHS